MKILYGTLEKTIDVTEICFNKLNDNNIITIPIDDKLRSSIFSDPVVGVKKKIFILNMEKFTLEFGDKQMIKINIENKTIDVVDHDNVKYDIAKKTKKLQSELKILYGDLQDELPEQRMVVRYLTGNENVLEIGSNIGRNSLMIGNILRKKNNNNFVTMECNPTLAGQLRENRDLNNMQFHIECSALSKRKLIQNKMDTIPSDVLVKGFEWVNTITWNELHDKYKIDFDTLILDCEGAFYYILMDMPEILNNIKLIIMENDYFANINHKKYVDTILKQNNFYVDYSEPGGWGPCYEYFYEVWKRDI